MLGRRRRRWANIEPTLVQRVVFAGNIIRRINKGADANDIAHHYLKSKLKVKN